MLKIAVTGPSGSGKGYICSILKEKGIACLDTDEAVHRIYRNDDFARTVSEALSADVRAPLGGVDRALLRPLVFSDAEKMALLQSLIYPRVREGCLAFLSLEEKKGALAAAVDAPQLFEAGFQEDYELIIAVCAPPEERIERIMNRDGITREAAVERISHQMSQEEYAVRSHAVVKNGRGEDPRRALFEVLGRYGVNL